jgi:hypothetical protein
MKERKKNEEKSKEIDKNQNDNTNILLFTNLIIITPISSDFSRIELANLKLTQHRA